VLSAVPVVSPIQWQPGVCTDATGANVQCSIAPALGEAWATPPCDPNASHSAGACVSANGTPQTQTPGIVYTNSLSSGSVQTAASGYVTSPINTAALLATNITPTTTLGSSSTWLIIAALAAGAFFMFGKKGVA